MLSISKPNGLKKSSPKLPITQWNSLFDCLNYILININFFKDAILYFSNTIQKCSIEINDEIINQLVAMSHVLKPIIDFTNIVQRDFVPVGTVFLRASEIIKCNNVN